MPSRAPLVAVVADDLTGAADTGCGFVRAGLTTTVTWAAPTEGTASLGDPERLGGTQVVAVDTRSRTLDAQGAEAVTAGVVADLRAAGVTTLYKKVDSTLRGHLAAEVGAALASWHDDAVAVVAPAFPATGRALVDARLLVNGARADRPSLPELLAPAGLPQVHLDLDGVRRTDLPAVLRSHRAAGVRILVCDAETDDDLHAIARAGVALGPAVVWVGSGGLASVLPARLGLTSAPPATPPADSSTAPAGPVLVAVGSGSDVARRQAAHLATTGAAHVRIPVRALDGSAGRNADTTQTAESVLTHLRDGRDVVLTVGTETGSRGADDALLVDRLGALLCPCAELVGGLVATGGDTATGILRAWGISALRLVGEVEPGVPLSVAVGARPIPVVTKAGAFGGLRTLASARDRLRGHDHA